MNKCWKMYVGYLGAVFYTEYTTLFLVTTAGENSHGFISNWFHSSDIHTYSRGCTRCSHMASTEWAPRGRPYLSWCDCGNWSSSARARYGNRGSRKWKSSRNLFFFIWQPCCYIVVVVVAWRLGDVSDVRRGNQYILLSQGDEPVIGGGWCWFRSRHWARLPRWN